MRGLFTKIFLFFWIAQSLTFVISTTLILQHRFAHPEQVMDGLGASLSVQGAAAADAYERGGCIGLYHYSESLQQPLVLADSEAHSICYPLPSDRFSALLTKTAQTAGVVGTEVGSQYAWSTATHSATGRRYLFVVIRPYQGNKSGWLGDLRHFAFPQLPVAIVVCGATTFVLVLLLTRPIARLRAAARDLANGKLATRVPKPEGDARVFGGDELQGLVHDFNYMAERLESLVDAQKMLVRDVSHELRSPLARLSVALELAREEAPAGMMNHLQRIEREAGRLNLLIGQLLRLSALESTNTTPNAEEFSLNGLLDDILPDAVFEAQQRSCSVALQTSCNCTVKGNPELLYRAIENVVRNAIGYTKEGSTVELNLQCKEQTGATLAVLSVSDHGPGIPDNELENIFRPFYRVDNARQRETGGFGVGLAIAERAVRLHRGEVSAKNRLGGGLMITLSIPCHLVKAIQPVEQ
jgi:two-component system, OmpR family, sensor histidine kinase CpxA